MEQILGWVIFGTGWPVLIVGSLWMWGKAAALPAAARTLLNVGLVSFYVLGWHTCTLYWQGAHWLAGVLPAFLVFLVLFIAAVRVVAGAARG